MRRFLFLLGGVSAAIAVYLAVQHGEGGAAVKRILTGRKSPVGEMAHQLQEAWADHHTSA